jgi:hypothetical protein
MVSHISTWASFVPPHKQIRHSMFSLCAKNGTDEVMHAISIEIEGSMLLVLHKHALAFLYP